MVLDLRGMELAAGIVVGFWCAATGGQARGYVEDAALLEPNRVRVRATSPGAVSGMSFELWAADCEIQRGRHGRPLRVPTYKTCPIEWAEVEDVEAVGSAGSGAGGSEVGRAGGASGGGPGGVAAGEPGPGDGPDAAAGDVAAGAGQ